MSKTQAEKQKAYRARQKVTREGNGNVQNSNGNAPDEIVTRVTKQADPPSVETVPESPDAAAPVGPLDVYSVARWTYLQDKGYTWDQDKQRSVRADGLIGVVVPGDPTYGELGNNKCKSCGKDTGHEKVVKCLDCCTAGVPNAPSMPVKTFEELPLDVQHQIDKHCSEANNGDRAGSHSRAAMTERAIAYQKQFGSSGKVAV